MDELPIKNRAEPHRRLLRHTYQEGPGFLQGWLSDLTTV